VLYNFNAKPVPWMESIRTLADSGQRWIFYGVDFRRSTNGFGTLYKITPTGSYSILYNFVQASGSVRRPRYGNTPAGNFMGWPTREALTVWCDLQL